MDSIITSCYRNNDVLCCFLNMTYTCSVLDDPSYYLQLIFKVIIGTLGIFFKSNVNTSLRDFRKT